MLDLVVYGVVFVVGFGLVALFGAYKGGQQAAEDEAQQKALREAARREEEGRKAAVAARKRQAEKTVNEEIRKANDAAWR